MKDTTRLPKDNQVAQLENEIARLNKKITKYEAIELKQNRFGLVWLDVPEAFEDDVENKLPILEEVPKLAINSKDGKPTHLLIEGDNYHALTCLNYTHKGKIDVIYIDPPYNTGSDGFKYKDKRILKKYPDGTPVPVEHPLRHSYWLSFMKKRLELCKDLLADTGVIFMSIDDNEAAQLKLLADEIFGAENFVAQLVWSGGRKNDSKLISMSHEYILCYVKSMDIYKEKQITWRQRKLGIDEIYKTYKLLKKKYQTNYKVIQTELKQWFKNLPDSNPAKNHRHYSNIDSKGVYFTADISWPGGGGPKYRVLHPKTGKPCKVPTRGWMFSKPEKMQEAIATGRVHFGEDENSVPCIKAYLEERETSVPYSVFYQDGRAATKRLRDVLGDDYLTNPKDENILAELIKFSSNKDAVVLDFFAGSGTTGHSVMKLNKEDDGKRQFILITNNDEIVNGKKHKIMTDVCYPRIKRVIQGYNSKNGLGNSIKYFKTAFVGKNNILKADDADKIELAHNAGGMLAIAENTFDQVEQNSYWQIFENLKQYMAVYFREEFSKFDDFVEKVRKLKKPAVVYIFSWEKEFEFNDFDDDKNIKVKTIPQPILEVYKQIYNLV